MITSARGEGLQPGRTFLGLNLAGQRDLLLFLVAEQISRKVLEEVARVGQFDDKAGAGIAFQVAIEDAVGLTSQLDTISHEIEDEV